MARPKKGEPGYEESINKWRKTVLKKFDGDEYAMSRFFQTIGRKGGHNGRGANYSGGFSSPKVGKDGLTGPERARIAGYKGGRISRRTGIKSGFGRARVKDIEEIEKEIDDVRGER